VLGLRLFAVPMPKVCDLTVLLAPKVDELFVVVMEVVSLSSLQRLIRGPEFLMTKHSLAA
jgi:hypothetical protein